ncbi:YqaA family protein [Leptospira fletcheri]|uniref:YqaA family protein n=1 Tax=Leptospira fletcheri TaxID=2484981 RepID=UPI001AF020F2|nr:VTT domain-containing protein [Leptospira fletcheri]
MDLDFTKFGSELIGSYGGLGLTLVSFAAATILPFSSEAALLLAIFSGMPSDKAVFWASVGNCSACLFNYGIGFWFRGKVQKKISESKLYALWASRIERRGIPVLLLSFLPIIGDPITILSGFFRQSLWIFVPIVFSLRILRYLLLSAGVFLGT